jgi:hypothetical protein
VALRGLVGRASTKPPTPLRGAEWGTLRGDLWLGQEVELVEKLRAGFFGLAEVLGDFSCCVVAAGAGYAVAGVGAVAAEVEIFYRGGVAGPA